MKVLTVCFFVFLGVYCLTYLYVLIISRKPFSYMIINAICGWWLFAVFELFSFLTGLHIPLNPGTVIVSGVFGAPGTLLLEVLRYCIFI